MAVNDRGHCKYMYMYMFECLSVIKLVTVNGNYYRMRTEDSNKPAYIYISRKHGSFFSCFIFYFLYFRSKNCQCSGGNDVNGFPKR